MKYYHQYNRFIKVSILGQNYINKKFIAQYNIYSIIYIVEHNIYCSYNIYCFIFE